MCVPRLQKLQAALVFTADFGRPEIEEFAQIIAHPSAGDEAVSYSD
jgi:hypothetical protein